MEDNSHLIGSPIMNHLVTEIIADNLAQKDLISARSVCRFWNQEFTRKIIVKFKNKTEAIEFCLINNQNLIKEKNLYNYFSKFDFRKWEALMDFSPLDLELIMKQISDVVKIKELILPVLELTSYEPILKVIAPTIERLEMQLKLFPKQPKSSDINTVSKKVFDSGDVIILEKIKKLIIKTGYKVDYEFFLRLLSSCRNIKELDLDKLEPRIEFKLIFNWAMKIKPHLKLLKLNYCDSEIPEKVALDMITLVKEGLIEKIKMEGLALKNENISEYFHVKAIYFPKKNSKLAKMTKSYTETQINSIYYLENDWFFRIPVENLLFHFPALKKVHFVDSNLKEMSNIINISSGVKYPTVTKISYASIKPDMENVVEKITGFFGNITSLSIKAFGKGFNFKPIFVNLTKLKKLSIFNWAVSVEDLFCDEKLIGLSEPLIEKLSLDKLDRNTLNQFENVKPSIALLKDLQVLSLFQRIANRFPVEKENDKRVTKFSFYFGFCKLPKLEKLFLRINSLKNIEVEHWNTFFEDFPQLKEITISICFENKALLKKLKEIKTQRPNLIFNIFKY